VWLGKKLLNQANGKMADETDIPVPVWFTMRFKGSTLKTVYLLKVGLKGFRETPSVENVNRVRVRTNLSPVKRLEPGKGILYCWEKFSLNY